MVLKIWWFLLVFKLGSVLAAKALSLCLRYGVCADSAPTKKGLWITRSRGRLVEVAGFEPASEDLQHNGPTCVANALGFAFAHAHRHGLERSLAQKVLIRRR